MASEFAAQILASKYKYLLSGTETCELFYLSKYQESLHSYYIFSLVRAIHMILNFQEKVDFVGRVLYTKVNQSINPLLHLYSFIELVFCNDNFLQLAKVCINFNTIDL